MAQTLDNKFHVVFVPSPGMGHLIPLVEFAKRLVVLHNFLITFFIPTDGATVKSQRPVLYGLPESISTVFLPPVSLDDLPDDVDIEIRITLTLTRSLPALRESLKIFTESTRPVAFVVDLLGLEAFEVAKEFSVLPYIFFPSTAMLLSFIFYFPKLDESTTCEYRDLPEPVKLPGCVPVHGRDLVEPIQNRKNETYKRIMTVSKMYNKAAGILINSFTELEPGSIEALKKGGEGIPPVYPVGPLTQTDSKSESDEAGCLSWLDKQPSGSVVFVSFGSGGTLTNEQLTELALGLEMSGQRFIWVVRTPHEKASNGTFFSVQSTKDPFDFLPKGFMKRTEPVCLVVPTWAPQTQILRHGSVGGFLTHCGWNSTLESIVNGVPLIAWPLYAEQKMNAVLLSDDLKVATRVKVNEKGVVGREDIAKYVKGVINGEEGEVMRKKMKELKNWAELALTQDGSSAKSLAEVASIWKNNLI